MDPTTAIATHTTPQDQCAQEERHTTDTRLCTEARRRDGVDMPDAGIHPHREAMGKQHTHTANAIALCAPAIHMSTM